MNDDSKQGMDWRGAIRFWEAKRVWYTSVLTAVVVGWVMFTWPHFRPALNLLNLGRMIVLGLLANVCYGAAYVQEFFMQASVPARFWRRFRWGVWILGMLFALLLENYWIADEIYPDVQQGAAVVGSGGGGPVIAASNMNFPAPLAIVGFLGAFAGVIVALVAVFIFWFARKPTFARIAGRGIGVVAVVYLALLIGFSTSSRDITLAHGQEKYFCEIDCHLAYAIVDVKAKEVGETSDYVVTLRTRFDEATTSPHRPKDAPLTPSPREVRLVDGMGHEYTAVSTGGTSLMTALMPAQSYTTELEFRVPKGARDLRLLVNTVPAWPDHVVIGDENSWMHKKTYFAL